MDYAENGQLLEWDQKDNSFKFTKPFAEEFLPEKELRRIFRDIVKGLYYRKLEFLLKFTLIYL